MSKTFIHKIEQIVLSNLENEKFGVSELASEMNLSRSQLLRKIKSLTGKSANRFIRELRLKEASKLILSSDLTASEIAYKVGFSSPSYFNKCFLDYFSQTPGEFKKQFNDNETFDTNFVKNDSKKKVKLVSVWVIVVLILSVGFYSLNDVFKTRGFRKTQHTSIAVLPLDDFSENKGYDYLASGITEAINLELSKNKSIRVISRGSSERFKGKKSLAYSDIAKELGVDLLLEGSVLPDKDSLLVVVQLIKPNPKEKHIWSNKYYYSTKNVLQLVKNLSGEIANEISLTLKPNFADKKPYKVNPEAYNLYLRGKYLWNNQKTRYESLINAQEYLEQSIKIDPNFAPAYVTLTETYIALNMLIGNNEERLKHRDNARKSIDLALELDQSLAEAYITKGNLTGKFDWDWEKMKKLVEKGLELEPNNVNGHQILSNYYTIKGKYKKAIKEAEIAETLDPLNPVSGTLVAERNYIAGNYKQSIEKYNQVLELNPDYGFALNGIGYVYFQIGSEDKSLQSWKKLQTIMKNDSLFWYYDNLGFADGIHFYLEKAKQNAFNFCSNPVVISSVQMMVNETSEALEYLKIAFKNKNEELPIMLTYPDFYPLHGNAEFEDLAQKVGVVLLK